MVEKARVTSIDNKLSNNKILDDEYTRFLRYLSNGKTIESLVMEREKAENQFVDDDIDPDFEKVLSRLKEWGNSYLLEDEVDGFVTIIKYEEQEQEYICSEREFDQEPKRKLRRFSRTENCVSNQSKSVEIENGNGSKSNSGYKGGIFSGKNSVSKLKSNWVNNKNEEQEEYPCSEKECDQEPKRKLRSASKKENGVSNQNKRVEIKSRNGPKLNSVNNKNEEREEYTCSGKEPKRKLRSASKKENGVSNQSKRVEIKSRNLRKSNLVNNKNEEQEEYTCSGKEPKRKLRSATKKENGVSNQSKRVEIKSRNLRKSNLVNNKNEEQEEYTCSGKEPKRKLRSASKKENEVSNQSKRVEIKSRNRPKSNSVNNKNEDREEYTCSRKERKRKLRSASKKENGVSNQSKRVEIKSRNLRKSNLVNNKNEEQEEYTCSEKECDQEPKRKLRSALKKENEVSNQSKSVEINSRNGRKSDLGNKGGIFNGIDSKGRSDCEKAVNFGTDGIEPDVDYYCFIKNCKFVDDCMLVYKYKEYEIVYCKKDEEKVKHDGNDSDGSSSDVEIIDSASFYKKDNVNEDGEVDGDFRRQVIANLKRPYDQMEYDKLWGDISFCKPKLHHKELRKGRELSCVMDTVGKSYLEYFPDIKRLLHKSRDDKLTSLNLLRGFFFWLKYQVRDGSFKPWQDTECLSLNPGSCLNFQSSFQCISLE